MNASPRQPNRPQPETGQASSSDSPESLPAAGQDLLPKIISFETLARCGEEVWIENNGQIYRLRRTRQGKLILTK